MLDRHRNIFVTNSCRHGLVVAAGTEFPWYITIQHGENLEHCRTFGLYELLEDATTRPLNEHNVLHTSIVEGWLKEVHAHEY